MQSTANGATAWQVSGNVFPLHASSSQIDDQLIFLLRPFWLLLGWSSKRMRCERRRSFTRGPKGNRDGSLGWGSASSGRFLSTNWNCRSSSCRDLGGSRGGGRGNERVKRSCGWYRGGSWEGGWLSRPRSRGRRARLEEVRDVQLCGWNDKRCLKHVCGRFNGLLEWGSRVPSWEGGLTGGPKALVFVVVVAFVVVVVVVVVEKPR